MEEKQRENYKLVITGGVSGKTAIVDRFVNNRFPETYVPTQAKRNVEKTLIFKDFENTHVTFDITDTSSDDRFKNFSKIIFKDQVLGIVVYDVTNKESFEEMKEKYNQLIESNQKNILICICGNKIDLKDKVQVPETDAKLFASQKGVIFKKVSAKTGEGVEDMFRELGSIMLNKKYGKNPDKKEVFTKTMGI